VQLESVAVQLRLVLMLQDSHCCCWGGSLVGRGAVGAGGGAVGVGRVLQESVVVQQGLVLKLLESLWCCWSQSLVHPSFQGRYLRQLAPQPPMTPLVDMSALARLGWLRPASWRRSLYLRKISTVPGRQCRRACGTLGGCHSNICKPNSTSKLTECVSKSTVQYLRCTSWLPIVCVATPIPRSRCSRDRKIPPMLSSSKHEGFVMMSNCSTPSSMATLVISFRLLTWFVIVSLRCWSDIRTAGVGQVASGVGCSAAKVDRCAAAWSLASVAGWSWCCWLVALVVLESVAGWSWSCCRGAAGAGLSLLVSAEVLQESVVVLLELAAALLESVVALLGGRWGRSQVGRGAAGCSLWRRWGRSQVDRGAAGCSPWRRCDRSLVDRGAAGVGRNAAGVGLVLLVSAQVLLELAVVLLELLVVPLTLVVILQVSHGSGKPPAGPAVGLPWGSRGAPECLVLLGLAVVLMGLMLMLPQSPWRAPAPAPPPRAEASTSPTEILAPEEQASAQPPRMGPASKAPAPPPPEVPGSDAGDLSTEAADELAALRKRSLEGAIVEQDRHRMEELMAQRSAARAAERLRRATEAVGIQFKDLFMAAVQQLVELILSDKSAIVGNSPPLALLILNDLGVACFKLKLSRAARDLACARGSRVRHGAMATTLSHSPEREPSEHEPSLPSADSAGNERASARAWPASTWSIAGPIPEQTASGEAESTRKNADDATVEPGTKTSRSGEMASSGALLAVLRRRARHSMGMAAVEGLVGAEGPADERGGKRSPEACPTGDPDRGPAPASLAAVR
ncbi:unnamed protein product, partial [Prorocentrum cordatum]